MNPRRMILIVAPPGNLQIGLQALLNTHLDVDVLVTGKGSSALKVIEIHEPAIVILDDDLTGDVSEMIFRRLQSNRHGTVRIVMVNDEDTRQKMLGKGAEYTILKGFPAQTFIALIDDLLSQIEDDNRVEPESIATTRINFEGGAYAD